MPRAKPKYINPIKPIIRDRCDLFKFLINPDSRGGSDKDWYAGDQLEALKYYTTDDIIILDEYMEDGRQGYCFAIFLVEDKIVIWRDSFGSCRGCDALHGQDGFEYIKSTLTEGNTLQFPDLETAHKYIKTEHNFPRYSEWDYMPIEMFNNAQEALKLLKSKSSNR